MKMIKSVLWLLGALLGFSGSFVYAQSGESITTIIVFRHAEKANEPGNPDPALSPEGINRSQKIAQLLKEADITAIYSTPYKRTKQTVGPLATAKNIAVQEYSPADINVFDELLKKHAGGKIVICAHSNTVPVVLNYFNKSTNFAPLREDEYDKLFIVSTNASGKSSIVKLVID